MKNQKTETKRVGLITLHLGTNFGSALQTFATYFAVRKFGYDCTLIDYLYPTKYHLSQAKRGNGTPLFVRILSRFRGMLQLAIKCKRILCGQYSALKLQEKRFHDFLARIPQTASCDMKSIVKDPPVFDIYLTGSDQCWNPRYMHHDHSLLLNFAPENAYKIAYSASFGSSTMASEYRDEYGKYLKMYRHVSVREVSGCSLYKELTGENRAEFVLDPTFLMDRTEWKAQIPFENRKTLPEKFILCYILEYVFPAFPAINTMIDAIAEKLNLPVVFIGRHGYSGDVQAYTVLDAGPTDFLDLFDRASFVVTTSFHGTAFSINFRKDFMSVLNPNATTDDRVGNILQISGLSDRGVVLGDSVEKILQNISVDYSVANEKIETFRKKSLDYLQTALDGWETEK